MGNPIKTQLPHLIIQNTATAEPYTSPTSGGGGGMKTPVRDRQTHALKLINQLESLKSLEKTITNEQKDLGIEASGIQVEFISDPEFNLKLESLEFQRSGIELCSSHLRNNETTTATVFIPEGKLDYFLKKVIAYRDEEGKTNKETGESKPKNQPLIDSITEIKLAVLGSLWTDDAELLPQSPKDVIWWEVWLRLSETTDNIAFFREHAQRLGLRLNPNEVKFIDRAVILAHGSREQISRSISLLGLIAELRLAKEATGLFTDMSAAEQSQWAVEAIERTRIAPDSNTYACLLDTGVNNEHPLLVKLAASDDMHSYDPAWGTHDGHHQGHGTPMAGLAAYGDLTEFLSSDHELEIRHRLESVKLLPNSGERSNGPELYGAITRESIARVEITPDRKRVFCMAISADDYRDRGKPSSWSASIDSIASGADDEPQRLILLAAGDTDPAHHTSYPESNYTDTVQDPGQSWNAVTVGGYTEKIHIHDNDLSEYEPLAQCGDLSPYSCTSTAWDSKNWPFKPDIVMEAGNLGINKAINFASAIDDLELLSTHHAFQEKLLVNFRETSAATALATRLTAILLTHYPELWPETLRALLIHSAQWTDALKARFDLSKKSGYRQLLQFCGYGIPDPEKLLWSASNNLTLIAEDSLQPFHQVGSDIKTRDIHLHEIPWPKDILEGLGDTPVEMKVTLSYFIEPNPGQRGWSTKYRYASHRLQFDVRRSLESAEAFKQRINKQARDEDFKAKNNAGHAGEWLLGANLRKTGSVHSDTWQGTAAELAPRQHVAVYPLNGWWKELKRHERWHQKARYSLIITISTPETDIYTEVANQVRTVIEI